MAANLQSYKLAKSVKRFVRPPASRDSSVVSYFSIRRGVHDSVYNKNPEELSQERGHSTVVPDNAIPPQPEEYWAPHPQTGVFGPAADQTSSFPAASRDAGSVMDSKPFFRPLEDLDKPEVQP